MTETAWRRGIVTVRICCMLSTVPSCFMYLICTTVLGSAYCSILWGKLRHGEVVSLCVGNSPCDFSNMFPVWDIGHHWGLASWSSALDGYGPFPTRRKKEDLLGQCSLSSAHCPVRWSPVQALHSHPEAVNILPYLLQA